MISSPWILLLICAVGASALMIGVWINAVRIANASYVDVAWAFGIAGTAVAYALLADGSGLHSVVLAGLGTIWGVRLGTHLLGRLAGKDEDGRYQELRRLGAERAGGAGDSQPRRRLSPLAGGGLGVRPAAAEAQASGVTMPIDSSA